MGRIIFAEPPRDGGDGTGDMKRSEAVWGTHEYIYSSYES